MESEIIVGQTPLLNREWWRAANPESGEKIALYPIDMCVTERRRCRPMKSKTLILITALALLVPVTQAGNNFDSLFGTWSGKRHRRSDVTGGQLEIFLGQIQTSALVANAQ